MWQLLAVSQKSKRKKDHTGHRAIKMFNGPELELLYYRKTGIFLCRFLFSILNTSIFIGHQNDISNKIIVNYQGVSSFNALWGDFLNK